MLRNQRKHRCKSQALYLRVAIPYKVMLVRTTLHVELLPSVYLRGGAQCLWKHSDVSILFLFDFQNFTDRSLGHANILSYSWSTHVTWSMVAKNRGVFLTVSFPKKIKASLPIGFWYFIKSTIEVNRRNTITFSIWILKLARNDKGFQYYENLPKIFLTHIFRKIKFWWIILLFFLNSKKLNKTNRIIESIHLFTPLLLQFLQCTYGFRQSKVRCQEKSLEMNANFPESVKVALFGEIDRPFLSGRLQRVNEITGQWGGAWPKTRCPPPSLSPNFKIIKLITKTQKQMKIDSHSGKSYYSKVIMDMNQIYFDLYKTCCLFPDTRN